jgi:hypothetical protein
MKSMATPPSKDRRQAVVVLGMHRSGTSAMARVVALAGAALPVHMLTPGPHNPEGFWEPHEVMALNERILADLDTSWNDPFGPREFRNREIPWQRYLGDAREIIARNYGDAQFIVVKEPRATLFVDLWREALENEGYRVSYVIMVRRPDEVAQSLKARDGTVVNKAFILWTTYMLAAELGSRGRSRVFVNFEDLLDDPEEVLNRVEAHLDFKFPKRTWDTALETQEFLKKDNQHHKSDRWPKSFKNFPQVERFYAYLAASSQDEPWNADISDEVSLWLSQLENIFGPVLKQSAREARQLEMKHSQAEEELTLARDSLEKSLEETRAELDTKVSQSIAEISNIRQMLSEVRDIAAKSEDRAADLNSELSRVCEERETLELNLRNILDVTQADLQMAQQRALDLEGALSDLRRERELREQELSGSLAAAHTEVQAARQRASELEAALSDLGSERDLREQELSDRLVASQANALSARQRTAELEDAMTSLGREHQIRQAELAEQNSRAERERGARELELQQEVARTAAAGNAAIDVVRREREAEVEGIRAQNTELARAFTEAIVKRPSAPRRWWRLFARR